MSPKVKGQRLKVERRFGEVSVTSVVLVKVPETGLVNDKPKINVYILN